MKTRAPVLGGMYLLFLFVFFIYDCIKGRKYISY